MKALRTSGTPLFSAEKRRNVAWRSQPGATSLRVPLWHHNPKGDWLEGLIRVPEKLAKAQPGTNEGHQLEALINSNLARWIEWRAMKGWDISGDVQIRGPVDPPTPRVGELPDPNDFEMVHYYTLARFKLRSPLYVGLDDVLEIERKKALFGVTVEADPLPWNDVTGSEDTGWIDPLKERAEHYAATGIKQADYLYD